MMIIPETLLAGWIRVPIPPQLYFCVLRRSYPNGLHVLILVRQKDEGFLVDSAVDHGVRAATWLREGEAANSQELALLTMQTCVKWNAFRPEEIPAAGENKRYYYSKSDGQISDPVNREILFQLAGDGKIDWSCQVWEDTEHLADSGQWFPIMDSLGFPNDRESMRA